MKRSTARWSTAMAVAALCVLPATGWTQTTPTTAQQPPTTAPSTTAQEPSSAAGAPGSTSAAQPEATASESGQVDESATKRHLSEARNTLSQITQLPSAAQLSGEPRTQVSELIANFNELITSTGDWHAAYAKVNANLTALVGDDSAAAESGTAGTAAGTQGTTAGATGAVGTSGSAATNLDPAIKAKLIEFRTHLKEFERAAGGGAASSAAAAPTSGSEDQTAKGTQPKSEAMGHSEAMRHIDAIEAILNGRSGSATAGTTGSTAAGSTASSGTSSAGNMTLDRAQLEQVRTHLTELRRLLSQAQDTK